MNAHGTCIDTVWLDAMRIEKSGQIGKMLRKRTDEGKTIGHDVLHQKCRAVPLLRRYAEAVLSQI